MTTTTAPAGGVPANDFLADFSPVSRSTWWAVVGSENTAQSFLLRTTDSGRDWYDVSPAPGLIANSYFLGGDDAWVESGSLVPPVSESLFRTRDGGASWQQLASIPSDCQLDFVDEMHGWCTVLAAAAGSEGVELLRTVDGGVTWAQVSYTSELSYQSSPHALPFGCDKSIEFTSAQQGWASLDCNGGVPALYETTDGGSDWYALAPITLPAGAAANEGAALGPPAVSGPEVDVVLTIGGTPAGTFVAKSNDGGRTWTMQQVGNTPKYWSADLIDPVHWRFTDGADLLSTDDGGSTWYESSPGVQFTAAFGLPLGLDFLSPRVGFAVPGPNGGPLWWTTNGGITWQGISVTEWSSR